MEQNPSSESNNFSASEVIPCIYGTRMFINVLKITHLLFLSWQKERTNPESNVFSDEGM